MLAIQVDSEGTLRWTPTADPELGSAELLVDVDAAGVNRADLLQRRGLYPPPAGASEILGLEVAGRVAEVGAEVSGWRVGQACMALLSGGGYAERVAVHAQHAVPLPAGYSAVEGAATVEAFLTAYVNLVLLGGLQAGERALIHGASGGVGTAAVQLARALGAEVWATCSPEKSARVRELGATRVVDYRDPEWDTALRAEGRVDVVLDVSGAKGLAKNLGLLASDGRLLLVGLLGGRRAELDLLPLLTRRLTLRGTTLRALPAERKASWIAEFARDVLPLLASRELAPVVHAEFPFPEAERAHAVMQAGGHVGKLVLTRP